jgi:hypothetical protein
MVKKKVADKEHKQLTELEQKLINARIKMFIQTLKIKQDMGMTRIYSAIQPTNKQQTG